MTEALFTAEEYDTRLARTQRRIADLGADMLVVTDPANIFYLTGYEAYSFYTPQALFVPRSGELQFFLRSIDAPSAWLTANLSESQVFGYPEQYVQQTDVHPMDWVGAQLRQHLSAGAVVAVEAESPFYTLRAHRALTGALGSDIEVTEVPQLVNWVRAVKSPAEIEVMRVAGAITDAMFATAREVIEPGIRQSEAVAELYRTQIRGVEAGGGTYSAIPPLVLAGENTAFPHVPWSDRPFAAGEAIALELSGTRSRYHVPLTRTMHLGTPPDELLRLADVVGEGLEATLAAIRPGSTGDAPASAWNEVIARHGLEKSSRVGYPIGIGFPPDWGEQTMSFRAGDATMLESGMTFHVMIGMWLEGRGYSISESVLVTDAGAESLTSVERGLLIKS